MSNYRVRRPAQYGRKEPRHFRAFEDVDAERLQLLAAILIEFNSAEETLDWCLGLMIENVPLADEIISRINGLDGKTEIIRRACSLSRTLSGTPAAAISDVLKNFEQCKTYRDALVHTRWHNEMDAIVFTVIKRGTRYEADVSLETLRAVYEHAYHLSEEMAYAYRLSERHWPDAELEFNEFDPNKMRAENTFEYGTAEMSGAASKPSTNSTISSAGHVAVPRVHPASKPHITAGGACSPPDWAQLRYAVFEVASQ